MNSESWWWTGRPGVLRFMGLQRVGHDWATELNWMFRFLANISCYEFSSCKREITILIANMWWAYSLGAQSCLVIAYSYEDNMFTMLWDKGQDKDLDTKIWANEETKGVQTVKRLPTMRESWVQSLGREDPLEKEMATHSSTLAWKIPWTEEPSRLQSVGSQRVGHDWATSLHFFTNPCSDLKLKDSLI